jgi:hypothetical protein
MGALCGSSLRENARLSPLNTAPQPAPFHEGRGPLFLKLAGGALALLAACGGGSSNNAEREGKQAPLPGGLEIAPLPQGVAFDLDCIRITMEELRAAEAGWQALQPADSSPGLRRRALTNGLLPRAALAAAYRVERAAAKAAAEQMLPVLELLSGLGHEPWPQPPAGGWPDGFVDLGLPPYVGSITGLQHGVLSGGFKEIGFELWAAARAHLGWGHPGQPGWGPEGSSALVPEYLGPWLGPVEGLGRFGLFYILSAQGASDPAQERFSLRVYVLPFIPEADLRDPEAHLRGRRLVAADPLLAESVQARLVALLAGQGATAREQARDR